MAYTRSVSDCPVLGAPRSLPQFQLPTNKDVLLACLQHRSVGVHFEQLSPKTPFLDTAKVVAECVLDLYRKASIPATCFKTVTERIMSLRKEHESILKYYQNKSRQGSDGLKAALNKFLEKCNKLFDIASCKCPIDASNPEGSICHCHDKSKRVPRIERQFLLDQRTLRQMGIDKVDFKVSKALHKREERKSRMPQRNLSSEFGPSLSHDLPQSDSDSDCDESHSRDDDFKARPVSSGKQMRASILNTALVSDRYGLSNRQTAAISSAVLKDFGIVTKDDTSCVIDKSKIQRSRSTVRRSCVASNDDLKNIRGLYFDGRKDKTAAQVKEGAKFYRRTQTEEHISLVQEPGSMYVGHVTPTSGTAAETARCILDFVEQNGGTECLVAVGWDKSKYRP